MMKVLKPFFTLYAIDFKALMSESLYLQYKPYDENQCQGYLLF